MDSVLRRNSLTYPPQDKFAHNLVIDEISWFEAVGIV